MLEIPERIGPYRVLSKVGEGGMGVVYKAEDQRLERVVALKVIREFEGDSSRRSRFWQEGRAHALEGVRASKGVSRMRRSLSPPQPILAGGARRRAGSMTLRKSRTASS